MNSAPERLLDATDPVRAFDRAHRAGAEIALPTSGTAGRPRLVVRTTASWVDSFPAVSELARLGPSARVWIPGPVTSTMNLFAAVHVHWAGASRVSGPAGASHLQLTPAALRRLLHAGTDLAGKVAVVAGDRLDAPLRVRAEAAGATVAHYYGAAELSFVAWGRDATTLRPFPGVEVQVRSDDLGDDQISTPMIWARSPYLALRTEGAVGPFRRDPAGFGTVGDRGRLDATGLRVVGRADTVLTGGATVLLADIETALRSGLYGEVAVVGLPHPELGVVIVAVLTDERDTALARQLAQDLGAGRPRRWYVRPALPLTAGGKIDRSALVAELRAEAQG